MMGGPRNQKSSASAAVRLAVSAAVRLVGGGVDMVVVMDPSQRPVADPGIVVLGLRLRGPPDAEPEGGEERGEADEDADHGFGTITYVRQ